MLVSGSSNKGIAKTADYFLLSLLDQILNSPSIQQFDKQSKLKLPTSMSCYICLLTTNTHKSSPFWSLDSLMRHYNATHQVEPRLDDRTKDEYVKALKGLSVIIESIQDNFGDNYSIILKILSETISRGWL